MESLRRNKMLLVDPESNCRLVNIDNGVVWWLIEGNKPLVNQYHQQAAKDYLTIVGGEDGSMELYRNRHYTKEMVWCKKEKDIKEFLSTQYKELELVASSKCIYLDGETGHIGEESPDNFLIVRKDYKMKFYSPTPYKTTVLWQLNFSRFRAFYPHSNEELKRTPIQVFHTINECDFYEFCTNFNVKNQDVGLLEHVKWKLPQNNVSDIELTDECVDGSKMVVGKINGLKVGVEKLPRKGDLSKHAINLRNLGVHDNILGFIKAETNGIHDMFVYHNTFMITMKQYLETSCDTTSERTRSKWIKVLRGLINGLKFLHIHDVRHGKLKLHNVFVNDNGTVKLAGLANIEWPSDEERCDLRRYQSVDILDWGKILLLMLTNGRHGNEDGVPHNLEGILDEFEPEDEEVKDLLRKVLHKNYEERPSFEEILQHPVFCDWKSRIELMTELSDFCEIKKKMEKKFGVHAVVQALDNVVGPQLIETSWKEFDKNPPLAEAERRSWKGKFDKTLLAEAERHRTLDYEYEKLTDLLRIFRNIISHFNEIKANSNGSLGNTKHEAELIFRQKFPNFFTSVREVAKTHLKDKFKSHFTLNDVDFKTERSQILVNPYYI